jgi:hypothetical protein
LRKFIATLVAVMGLALTGCETETGCKDDYDCDGKSVCNRASGTCQNAECVDDAGCSGGKVCDDSICVDPPQTTPAQ